MSDDDEKDYDEEETDTENREKSVCLVQYGYYTNNVGNTYNNFTMGYNILITFLLFLLLLK
jgi:hypothetical protein